MGDELEHPVNWSNPDTQWSVRFSEPSLFVADDQTGSIYRIRPFRKFTLNASRRLLAKFAQLALECVRMPYADPARSPYCAARHLLRHVGNARELRRNPLVLSTVDGQVRDDELVRIARGLVDRALSAIDAPSPAVRHRHRVRHAAILLRYDIIGQSRASVARDLGISLAQFERERRAAMVRFLTYFQQRVECTRASVQSVRSSLARVVCERALRLSDSGDRESALTLLGAVARGATPADRIRALICISDVETAYHQTDRSQLASDAASTLLREGDLSETTRNVLRIAHEAGVVRLKTIECGPYAASLLVSSEDLPKSPESVALLLARAEALDGSGMIREARPLLFRAAARVAEIPETDPSLRIDLAFFQSQLNFWNDRSSAGRSGLEEAVEAARSAGYLGRAAFAELWRLGGDWTRSGRTEARRAYRAFIDRIERTNETSRNIRFVAFWDAADMECAIGDPWRAADAARKALELAPNLQWALSMKALLARAYARGGRLGTSRQLAWELIDRADLRRSGAAVLSTKRTLAYVAANERRTREAWEHLADAADLARYYGTARVAEQLDDAVSRARRQSISSVSITF